MSRLLEERVGREWWWESISHFSWVMILLKLTASLWKVGWHLQVGCDPLISCNVFWSVANIFILFFQLYLYVICGYLCQFVGFNDDEICEFVKLTVNKNVDVRFIEYMPFSGNKWEMQKMVPYDRMVETIRNIYPEFHPLKNEPNDTSKVGAYTIKITLG